MRPCQVGKHERSATFIIASGLLRMGREEYRRWTEESGRRAERVSGEVIAMVPERAVYNRVKANVYTALKGAIRTGGLACEAFTNGMTIEVDDDTDYEPDAVVRCGQPLDDNATVVPDPIIIVEVSSPSTRAGDTGNKLADYFRVASVQHYLIVRADRRQVIHHRRGQGRIETHIISEGDVLLDPSGFSVGVAAFYAT